MELLIITIILIALAIAAQRWGADSTEGIDSAEWQRRQLAARRRHQTAHHL